MATGTDEIEHSSHEASCWTMAGRVDDLTIHTSLLSFSHVRTQPAKTHNKAAGNSNATSFCGRLVISHLKKSRLLALLVVVVDQLVRTG